MIDTSNLLTSLPGPPLYEYDWRALTALPGIGDWLWRMDGVAQSPTWHGEGNVAAHTRRVCEALCRLADFQALPDDHRNALALAALLHDVGKLKCSRQEGGDWVAPHHGPVGARMVRMLLWTEYGLCGEPSALRFREAVCQLIRYHGAPLHLMDEPSPERWVLRLAANGELAPAFTLRSLCLLAQADVEGRVAPDRREQLEAVALARMQAGESGCLDGPWPFPGPRTRRALLSGGSVWKEQALYDPSWGEVVLMCGLPGVGKDAWLRQNLPGLPTVSLDDLRRTMGVGPEDNQGRVIQAARERAREFLRAKQPFAWNATNLTAQRGALIELFEAYGARVRVVYLETPWEENLRRNADRPDAVPEHRIGEMLARLEPPEVWEADRVAYVCV